MLNYYNVIIIKIIAKISIIFNNNSLNQSYFIKRSQLLTYVLHFTIPKSLMFIMVFSIKEQYAFWREQLVLSRLLILLGHSSVTKTIMIA